MTALLDFYRKLIADDPTIRTIPALILGGDMHGRGFGSPSLAEHVAALKTARAEVAGVGKIRSVVEGP